tara:strand:- start:87128 stop:87397 length:270 start_codon:yes stop_codon:yes gene_type:complete
MLYFILWVIFLLFVVLAIPVTSMLEKRKYRSGVADQNAGDSGEEFGDEEPIEEQPAADDDMGMGDDMGEFADSTPAAGDDFSAFEDDFK